MGKKKHDIHTITSRIRVKEANGMDCTGDLAEGLDLFDKWVGSYAPPADEMEREKMQFFHRHNIFLSEDPEEAYRQCLDLTFQLKNGERDEFLTSADYMVEYAQASGLDTDGHGKGYRYDFATYVPPLDKQFLYGELAVTVTDLREAVEQGDRNRQESILAELSMFTLYAHMAEFPPLEDK
jgi:hypothetical protein